MRKARAFFFVCAGLLGLVLLLPRPAAAAWPTDPTANVPLCTTTNDQINLRPVSDGAGGAIVTWQGGAGATWPLLVGVAHQNAPQRPLASARLPTAAVPGVVPPAGASAHQDAASALGRDLPPGRRVRSQAVPRSRLRHERKRRR